MQTFLTPKFLLFYGASLGFVVTLFSVATSYGESQLKAQGPIGGQYLLSPAQPLPSVQSSSDQSPLPCQCLFVQSAAIAVKGRGTTSLAQSLLSLQQSGRYVTANILAADASTQQKKTASQRPALIGRWDTHQLNLAGQVLGCPQSVTLQGTIKNGLLVGAIQMGSETLSLQGIHIEDK